MWTLGKVYKYTNKYLYFLSQELCEPSENILAPLREVHNQRLKALEG